MREREGGMGGRGSLLVFPISRACCLPFLPFLRKTRSLLRPVLSLLGHGHGTAPTSPSPSDPNDSLSASSLLSAHPRGPRASSASAVGAEDSVESGTSAGLSKPRQGPPRVVGAVFSGEGAEELLTLSDDEASGARRGSLPCLRARAFGGRRFVFLFMCWPHRAFFCTPFSFFFSIATRPGASAVGRRQRGARELPPARSPDGHRRRLLQRPPPRAAGASVCANSKGLGGCERKRAKELLRD